MSSLSVVVVGKTSSSFPEFDFQSWVLLVDRFFSRAFWSALWAITRFAANYILGVVIEAVSVYDNVQPWVFWGLYFPSLVYSSVVGYFRVLWLLRTVVKYFWLLIARHTTLGWLSEVFCAFVYRMLQVPDPVLRGEETMDPTLPMVGLAHARGNAYAQAANVRFASLAAGGLTATRLRQRSRWVRSLEKYLGGRPGVVGSLVRGRWTPDLPSSDRPVTVNAVLGIIDDEVKLLGGGVLPTDDLNVHEPYLVVEGKFGKRVVIPSLLGRLSRGTFGRERDASLMAQLRSRAVEWCQSVKLAPAVQPLVIPGHVELAMYETGPERVSREALEEAGIYPSPCR